MKSKYGNRRTHGMSKTPLYRIWAHMLSRCTNKNAINFDRYGGRGITVCEEWRKSFAAFFRDMGPRPSPDHSIERRDNSLGYFKENCVWADRKQQGANKRNNRRISFHGCTKTLTEWCRDFNLNYNITRQRMDRDGWTPERALTTATATPCKN